MRGAERRRERVVGVDAGRDGAAAGRRRRARRARTRSGWRVASAVATKPPIEWPVTTALLRAQVVEDRRAVVGVLGDRVRRRAGRCCARGPRRSGATSVASPPSASATRLHERWLEVIPCAASTSGPSPDQR